MLEDLVLICESNKIRKCKVLGRDFSNALPVDITDYMIDRAEKNPQEIIDATINRINSMALIHEKIYGSTDLAHVNIKEYIEEETQYLIPSLWHFLILQDSLIFHNSHTLSPFSTSLKISLLAISCPV